MKQTFRKAFIATLVIFLITAAFPFAGFAEVPNSHLVAHYTFDGDLKDVSGNGNDGTSFGDVTFADDGIIGKSAEFNGGYIKVNNAPGLNLGNQFTVSVWVKVNPAQEFSSNENAIISKLDDRGNYNNYYVYARGGFGARADFHLTSGEVSVLGGAFDDYAMEENWTNLVWTCDGQAIYMYVNGNQRGMREIKNGDSVLTSESFMRIGTGNDINNTERSFRGKMDDLRIYNVGLSPADIKALYNTGGVYNHKIVLQLNNQKMVVDNQEKYIDSINRTAPIIIENRTMVPIRAIIENMGGTVGWNAAEKRINITLKSKQLTLWVDRNTAELNGQQLGLDVPPKVINNRTLVPLRFVSENLGCKVEWDGNAKKVTLRYSK